MSGRDDSFLARWSRRKRAVAEEEAQEAAAPALLPEEPPEEPVEERTDAEILEELGLKDPDLLEAGDDFRAFMQAAVPDHLRRRALRKLWVSNPVLANLDGLNDYDDDFTGGSVAPGMLKTAYQVGKGYLRDLAEAPETPSEPAEEVAAQEAPPDTKPPQKDEIVNDANSGNISDTSEVAGNNAMECREPVAARRRKMQFRY